MLNQDDSSALWKYKFHFEEEEFLDVYPAGAKFSPIVLDKGHKTKPDIDP